MLRRLIEITGGVTSGYVLQFLAASCTPYPDGDELWVSAPKLCPMLGIKKWDYTRDLATLDALGLITVQAASSKGTRIKVNLIEIYNQVEAIGQEQNVREYYWALGLAELRNKSISNIPTNLSNNSIDLSNSSIEQEIGSSNSSIDSSDPSIDLSNNSIEVSHKDESPSLSPPSQTLPSLTLPLIREEKEEEKILRASDMPETPLCVTFSWEAFRPSDYSVSLAEGTDINLRLLASRFKDWHLKRNKVYCDMETAQQVFHTWLKTDIQRGSKYTKKGKLKLTL